MARIVFCEDEELIRKLMEVAMRSTAHTIEMTENGREALVAIERLAPDVIVTDVAMPKMGGFALADAVHAKPALKDIPIMFVTASVQRGDLAKFTEHGGAGYLAKPFSPKALRDKIDELVGPS
jgi:two-component system, OmpR family, response regulator